MKTEILNINFNNITIQEALSESLNLLKLKTKSNIFFLNADCLLKSQKDEEYKSIINNASLLLSDGIGLKLACKYKKINLKDNCNGTDFSTLLMKALANNNNSIFLLGGHKGVPEKVKENLEKQIPYIKIVGTHHGFFSNDKKVIESINKSKADVLFVALSVPKQEKWINKYDKELTPKIRLGVGSLFNFLSGRIKRAPSILRKIHLEWLFRVLMEPKRLFKRYFIDTFKLFLIIKNKK